MGLASKDPGMLSVNVTFSPTFAGASTSGTSGCKKWKFSAQVRQEFVESQWAQLREASAQGRGAHLAVFSNVMGCETSGLHVFSQIMLCPNRGDLTGFRQAVIKSTQIRS